MTAYLAQAGESMTTVWDLLGHSSLIVTSRYAHLFDAGLDDIATRLPRLNSDHLRPSIRTNMPRGERRSAICCQPYRQCATQPS